MAEPSALLIQRNAEGWDVMGGQCDRPTVLQLARQRSQFLSESANPLTLLLLETEPVAFLASFLAAAAVGCRVVLGNPHWEASERRQVLSLIQPDLIWDDATVAATAFPAGEADWQLPPAPAAEILIATGGSSGQIRFATHTWETLSAAVWGFQQHFQVERVHSVCVLPLYHVSGLMQFMRSLLSGGKLAIASFKQMEAGKLPDLQPADFFLSLVPTQLRRLLNAEASWLSTFQTVLLGGAPAWADLLEQARRSHIPLALTYGMTETAAQIATLKPAEFLQGLCNCGRVLPHAQVMIRDPQGNLLGSNQIGRLTIYTSSLALGYFPEQFDTSTAFQTDDLGYLDDRGYLTVVGRNSNKIITGGENVFPAEVEAVIRSTPGIADVCVLGVPDRDWGEAVTAIYVPLEPSFSITELRSLLTKTLSRYKQPKHWIAAKQLPRNAQGKLNYAQLKAIAMQHLAQRNQANLDL